MAVIKLTLAYNGSNYHGWQRQPMLPTIQGQLETALRRLTQQAIPIHGAGRTDAGVHALGQVAHFSADRRFQPRDWIRGLNALLPEDIVINAAEAVNDRFHARYSAKKKHYRYVIRNTTQRSPFERQTSWLFKESLVLDQMSKAAKALCGEHSFTSFCAARSEVNDHNIDLKEIQIEKKEYRIALTFKASRFLQYMVRNIVGFLVEVGRGKRSPDEVSEILEAKDRTVAGPTAPPHGLFLLKVDY